MMCIVLAKLKDSILNFYRTGEMYHCTNSLVIGNVIFCSWCDP